MVDVCLLVVYIVFTIYLAKIVTNWSVFAQSEEKMRLLAVSIWPIWLSIFAINGEITLESVFQKVADLEIAVNTLKVIISDLYLARSLNLLMDQIFLLGLF